MFSKRFILPVIQRSTQFTRNHAHYSTRQFLGLKKKSHNHIILGGTALGLGVFLSLNGDTVHAEPRSTQIYSWGFGQYGQLGHGKEENSVLPEIIEALEDKDIVQISCRGLVSAALTRNGELYTFGCGQDDRLGHGHSFEEPNQTIPRLVDSLQNVRQVSCGDCHMLAITTDNKVWSWGKNWNGQLGHKNPNPGYPSEVEGLSEVNIVYVDAGRQHSAAIDDQGRLYTWGSGFDCALGHGNKLDVSTPKLVEGFSERIISVKCGHDFTVALTENGKVYSWGCDDYGQLGHGKLDRYSRQPRQIRGVQHLRIKSIAVGEYHTMAIAENGEVFSWGYGKDGQLGHGDRSEVIVPRLIEDLRGKNVVSISCGGMHSACVLNNGELYMWGMGRNGQLGRGDQLESIASYRTRPLAVETFSKAKHEVLSVALGLEHSLALTNS